MASYQQMFQKRPLPMHCSLMRMYEPVSKMCVLVPVPRPRYAPVKIIEHEDLTGSDSRNSPPHIDIAVKQATEEIKIGSEVKAEVKSLDEHLAFILDSMRRPKKGDVCDKGEGRLYEKMKRKRKTTEQTKMLHCEFESRGGKVSKQIVEEIATKLGLKSGQVYKWFWDHQKSTKKTDNM